jgi:LysM repeat protein
MTVRLPLASLLAAVALLFVAGCGGGGNAAFTAETDDPYYREGQRLVRQGREAEALSAFLKVIEKRGEQGAAEAHLEAGLIYLSYVKNPIEAIHHFRKFLELQPNAKQAAGVRSLIDTATREFARTIPAHPLESQVIGLDQTDLVRQLQKENDELRAELTAQRTASTTQFLRSSRATIDGDTGRPPAVVPEAGAMIMPAPLPARGAAAEPTITPAPSSATVFSPPSSAGKGNRPAPAAGRRHTVTVGDTLYNIAKRYGVKMEDIVAANREVLPTISSPLRRGTELKIP